MADMRRERLRLALEVRRHHVSFHSVRASRRRSVTVLIIVVVVSAAVKVGGTLVLIRTAVLQLSLHQLIASCQNWSEHG